MKQELLLKILKNLLELHDLYFDDESSKFDIITQIILTITCEFTEELKGGNKNESKNF